MSSGEGKHAASGHEDRPASDSTTMTPSEYDPPARPDSPARQGAFDDQLTFPSPIAEAPAPILTIVKRDGSEVPFQRRKIAEAIFRAAASVGKEDWDWSRSMAAAVTLYLGRVLAGQPPGVRQVRDAVERVLEEMGHTKTALAYLRFRERRERTRRLREGNAPPASHSAPPGGAPGGSDNSHSLLAHAPEEALPESDRAGVLRAVIREVGIDGDTAAGIAADVEEQIRAARLGTLTVPLLRELVGAKLVERGLQDHWRRHRRVGLPLAEAEAIVCGPFESDSILSYDPEITDGLLAERMKREIALTRVYSPEVADAHARGDLHLHGPGQVDRLDSLLLPLGGLQRYGMAAPGGPPRDAHELLSQMVGFTAILRRHFSGTIGWDALNYYFAPYLSDLGPDALRGLAHLFLYEFAYGAASASHRSAPLEITLCWDLPENLRDVEAVGPGGAYTGQAYDDFLHPAQQFAWVLLDLYREAGGRARFLAAPTPLISLTSGFFHSPGHEEFLEHAARAVPLLRQTRFEFHREAPFLPHTEEPFQPRHAIAHRVTLNLPRAAYRGLNEQGLLDELDRLLHLAALAHFQKKTFIRRLLDHGEAGALGLLAGKDSRGALLDLDRAVFLVGITGLSECVHAVRNGGPHEPRETGALAEGLLAHLSARCAEWSDSLDLLIATAPTSQASVDRRFAALDLEHFGDTARKAIEHNGPDGSIRYTSGAALGNLAGATPMERIRIESPFHPLLGHGALTRLPIPDPDTSPASIAHLIEQAARQTACRGIAFDSSSR